MHLIRFSVIPVLFAAGAVCSASAVQVDVNVNVKHSVGGISTFDRSKFITIHSNHDNGDWLTDNVLPDLMDDFLNGNNVYFGRNTGGLTWYSNNQTDEDPAKPGWPKVAGSYYTYESRGQSARNAYDGKTWAQAYEARAASDVLCAQYHPFWPDGTLTARGWAPSQADTAGEPFGSASGYMVGQYYRNFYANAANGNIGAPQPGFVEVINEPEWELWGWDPPGTTQQLADAQKLWKFHNSVAAQIKAVNGSQVKVGGYCSAFPDHQNSNFQEWEREWKDYIDNCGSNLDFYSIHLYDFNEKESAGAGGGNTGGYAKMYRRGSNLEATLDMIEHYSALKLGEAKPFVVSEYGGRARNLEAGAWSAFRDWQTIKSISSMLMSFADRPNLIYKTIPFIMLKEEWAYTGTVESVHSWRLMRRQNEPTSYTGSWVYTEMVKFYQLWSEVKGTRVDIVADDPDVQIDAYVDGDRAYVILNNLGTAAKTVNLNLFDSTGNPVTSVLEKSLHWGGSGVALDQTLHTGSLSQVSLPHEGTVILRYTFSSPVVVDETKDQVKYYATTHYTNITANVTDTYQINGVAKGVYGEAVLRLGMGRSSTLSRQPAVLFNGTPLTVTPDFMGTEGDDRPVFLGELNIPVPYALLESNNTVEVTFPDTGGYISSVALRAYEFSTDIRGSGLPGFYAWSRVAGSDLIMSFSNGPANGWFDLFCKTNLLDPVWQVCQSNLPINAAGFGSVTNPIGRPAEFFRLLQSSGPAAPPLNATFDWTAFSGVWWSDGYGYAETNNGIVLVQGGRAAAHENGYAFKASYTQDAVDGTFNVQLGGADQPFRVTSIDISSGVGPPAGQPLLKGMLGSVEQWTIDPVDGVGYQTYTNATTGDMTQLIDRMIWSAPYDPDGITLSWDNRIDNLQVAVPAP